MNVLKNFEALFVVTLGLACAANFALENAAQTAAQPQASAQASYSAAPAAPDMQVVVVSARRMTTEQKKQSLIDEGKGALTAEATAARKI